MELKDSVQQQFAAVAASYANSAVHQSGPDLAALVAAVPANVAQALDVGCGPGHTALAIAPHVGAVTGLDLTEAMLAEARRLAAERGIANARFERGDVEQLPFADGSFDLVTSRYSAHHYPRPAVALAEIARVLRPGGVFLLADVVAPEPLVADTYLTAIELLRDPSHVRDHSVEQWLDLLSGAGMRAELLGAWPLRLQFDNWVARMRTPEAAAGQIRALLDGAPVEARTALAVEADHSFSVPIAVIRAVRPGQ
jgi:ubiquinone/menaquinone biosynthesis C-methylase UbiE